LVFVGGGPNDQGLRRNPRGGEKNKLRGKKWGNLQKWGWVSGKKHGETIQKTARKIENKTRKKRSAGFIGSSSQGCAKGTKKNQR